MAIRYGWCGDRKIDPVNASKLKKEDKDSVVSDDITIDKFTEKTIIIRHGWDIISNYYPINLLKKTLQISPQSI